MDRDLIFRIALTTALAIGLMIMYNSYIEIKAFTQKNCSDIIQEQFYANNKLRGSPFPNLNISNDTPYYINNT